MSCFHLSAGLASARSRGPRNLPARPVQAISSSQPWRDMLVFQTFVWQWCAMARGRFWAVLMPLAPFSRSPFQNRLSLE
jgi:hypothetical protein